jgi:hypothetical protein
MAVPAAPSIRVPSMTEVAILDTLASIFFPFLLVFHGFGMEHRHRMLGYRPSLLVRFCTLVVVSSNALRKAELTGKQQLFISSIS